MVVDSILPWILSECVHFLGKYPGHGSNLYGYLWVDADSISANITNNSARREKVSKWLIFSLSRPGRTESHSSIYPSPPVSGKCKQNQKLVCINILKLVKQMGKQIQTNTIIDLSWKSKSNLLS